jgi:glycosyltransferase involved in cell wall biosynthesis
MAISLITSLYRSEKHLPNYIRRVQSVAAQLDFPLEIVIVANEATDNERTLLETLQPNDMLSVNIIHTERETLYTSWNRGFEAAQYEMLGAWNVDDIRTVEGLTAAYKALDAGYQVVDFAYDLVQGREIARFPAHYRPDSLAPKAGLGAFFVIHRELYSAAGGFNPNFKITGDYEWSKRPVVRAADYQSSHVVGGQFVQHGGNLSGNNNPLQWVEFNIALIWYDAFEHLRPVEPELMRQTWEAWGHTGGSIPDAIADWLWGAGAEERYAAYSRERNAHPLLRRMRLALARRGLMHSAEWNAQQKPFKSV